MKHFLSHIFLLAGVILLILASYLLYLRYSPQKLAFSQSPETVKTTHSVAPTRVIIPSVGINSPVFPSIIKNNKWQTSNTAVSYVKTSAVPGKVGNSVFYGHNWNGILADLPKVKPGNAVYVEINNGTLQKFIVEYTAIVDPTLTAIIDQTTDTRITIYTCTGFLDLKRFVVVAKAV